HDRRRVGRTGGRGGRAFSPGPAVERHKQPDSRGNRAHARSGDYGRGQSGYPAVALPAAWNRPRSGRPHRHLDRRRRFSAGLAHRHRPLHRRRRRDGPAFRRVGSPGVSAAGRLQIAGRAAIGRGQAAMTFSLFNRLDNWARNLPPFALTLLMLIIGTMPLHLPYFVPLGTGLAMISVYYWAIHRPGLLPAPAVF